MAYLALKTNWQRETPYLALKEKKKNILGKTKEKEIYIKKDKVNLIIGGKGAGKTRELLKISKWSKRLYKREGIYINAEEPLSDWYKRVGLDKKEIRGLGSYEKNMRLIRKIRDKIVCIDNIEKATGQKKEVIKWMIKASYICYVSARNIKEIDTAIIKEMRIKGNIKAGENINTIDLGNDFEIIDISQVLAIIVILILVIIYEQYWALGLIFVFRVMHREGKQK